MECEQPVLQPVAHRHLIIGNHSDKWFVENNFISSQNMDLFIGKKAHELHSRSVYQWMSDMMSVCLCEGRGISMYQSTRCAAFACVSAVIEYRVTIPMLSRQMSPAGMNLPEL